MTIDDFIRNRDEYLRNGRSKSGSRAQKRFREEYREGMIEDLMENKRKTYEEAEKIADDFMSQNDVLHDPDQVAGGFADKVTGMGSSRINQSLGSQWSSRIKDIDREIRKIAETMSESERKEVYLNIKLLME